MENCIFCRIAEGEIPAYKIYEDDSAVSFLDLNPVTRGHALVVPKEHFETIFEMEAGEAGELFSTVKRVADSLDSALSPDGMNLVQNNREAAGQEVPHLHFHLIPRYEGDGFGFDWNPGELDEGEAEELVETIGAEV